MQTNRQQRDEQVVLEKRYYVLRSAKLRVSWLVQRRSVFVVGLLALLTFAAAVVSLGIGELRIPPGNVVASLFGFGDASDHLILFTFRMPRLLVALLAGAALAAAGAILQGVVRNPLASPDVLGVTSGASAAAVAFLTLWESHSVTVLPVAAFGGAAVTMFLLYVLAWKKGITPFRLVLVGIGINAAATALTTLLLVTSPMHLTGKAYLWLTGSVYGSNWGHVQVLALWLLVLLPLAFGQARAMNAQGLGDEVAVGLGSPVQRQRLYLLLLCTGLAGAAVAIVGAVGFLALLAPHIARRLVGPSFGALLPASALVGSLLMILADLVARTAMSPLDLPVGIFTSAIGAPFFLYLLYRTRIR